MIIKAERQQEVLSYIIGLGGWLGPVAVSAKQMSDDMGFTPEVARKAISKLRQRGALKDYGRCEGRYQHRYQAMLRCHQLVPGNA